MTQYHNLSRCEQVQGLGEWLCAVALMFDEDLDGLEPAITMSHVSLFHYWHAKVEQIYLCHHLKQLY